MAYHMVYLRIKCNCYNSGYGKDSGWASDAEQAAFKEESRRVFQELGWTIHAGRNGVSDTVTKGHQDLYLHPTSFSGVVDEADSRKHLNRPTTARFSDEVGFFAPCRPMMTGYWELRRSTAVSPKTDK